MKKIFSLLLSLILIAGLVPVSLAAGNGTYIVTDNFAAVYKSPSVSSEKLYELTKNTFVEISEIRSTGFGKTVLRSEGITGWILMEALTKVTPTEESTSVKSIKIRTLPEKLTYVDGLEELDLTGLSVVKVDKNNKEAPVSGYTVYAPAMKTPGEKTVTVSWSPDGKSTFTADFSVTVVRVPVKSLKITKAPKTSYKEHERLDLSELKLLLGYESSADNRTYTYEEIINNSDFTFVSCHDEVPDGILSEGSHSFTVYYKYTDISCSFSVSVSPRKLIGLEIVSQPKSLTVHDNKSVPSLEGLVLKASYDNGETEEIPFSLVKAECDPSQFIIGPGNEVRAYFGELYVTLYFRYSPSAIEQGIRVQTPVVLTFLLGEKIDLSELRVYLYYTDGTYTEITDYEMSEIDYSVSGTQNITVKYKNFSEVFSVIISPYFSKGDVDGNGKITANDARQALRGAVGLVQLKDKTFFAGDADRNGKITANDARLILRASVDLENLYETIK